MFFAILRGWGVKIDPNLDQRFFSKSTQNIKKINKKSTSCSKSSISTKILLCVRENNTPKIKDDKVFTAIKCKWYPINKYDFIE